jgi:hypothetical protein
MSLGMDIGQEADGRRRRPMLELMAFTPAGRSIIRRRGWRDTLAHGGAGGADIRTSRLGYSRHRNGGTGQSVSISPWRGPFLRSASSSPPEEDRAAPCRRERA